MIDFSGWSEDRMIDHVQKGVGSGVQTAMMVEMQRRLISVQSNLIATIQAFDQSMKASSGELVKLTKDTSEQTDKLVLLTKWIIALTVILGLIAAGQFVEPLMMRVKP